MIDPVTGRVRARPNEEMRRLTAQPFIISVISSKKPQWAGNVARAPPSRAIKRCPRQLPHKP